MGVEGLVIVGLGSVALAMLISSPLLRAIVADTIRHPRRTAEFRQDATGRWLAIPVEWEEVQEGTGDPVPVAWSAAPVEQLRSGGRTVFVSTVQIPIPDVLKETPELTIGASRAPEEVSVGEQSHGPHIFAPES